MSDKFQKYVEDIYQFANQKEFSFPRRIIKAKIYDHKPAACADTFLHSMYLEPQTDYIDAVVLYAPNLELLQTIDNDSPATLSYKKGSAKGLFFP